MKHLNETYLGLCALGILACFSGTAGATTIFTEDFNSFTGVLNGNAGGNDGQHFTNHDLAHSGNVTGWSIWRELARSTQSIPQMFGLTPRPLQAIRATGGS